MLTIEVPPKEIYDEATSEFSTAPGVTLVLEHSLISLSKWESSWKVPFLSDVPKTDEQTLDYIMCMTITRGVSPYVYDRLPQSAIEEITQYIADSQTATTFTDKNTSGSKSAAVTAEVIYYWMVALQIPFECQKWHLSRLLTLVQVCNNKSQPQKKKSRSQIMRENRDLNAARRAKYNTTG